MPRPDDAALTALRARQHDAVTVAQLQAVGADRSWIRRRVVDGAWQRLHPGVLVLHSGPIPWFTRAQAAVLSAGPGAMLSHRAAAHLHGWVQAPSGIEVSVPHSRRPRPTPGVVVRRRRTDLASVLVRRVRVTSAADTVLDLLDRQVSDDDALGRLCAAVRSGTSPTAILTRAGARPRLPRRALVIELLSVVDRGIESPLEHRYQRDVEHAHGLPVAQAQVRDHVGGRWIRADRVYQGLGVRVELDGRLAHHSGRSDADTWRDNAVRVELGQITLRYLWEHVVRSPCRTAAQVAAALSSRGHPVVPRPCRPGCPVTTGP